MFWGDQINDVSSLVKVPACCLGVHFIVNVVASNLLKTKHLSNAHTHRGSQFIIIGQYMFVIVITGSEIKLYLFNLGEPGAK